MDDPVEIARGLTSAARSWILNPGYVDPNTIRLLRRKGVLGETIATGRRLTDLGLAVRTIIQQEALDTPS